MGEDELAAIEARTAVATRGPWRWEPRERNMSAGIYTEGEQYCHSTQHTNEDAAFIANARTDIPRLVAEVRRLRALLAETLPFLACYPCDDQEEGEDLTDLERRIDAALAGEEG